jgi:crotonobetaine/carnitine-CoA ligase
MTLVGHASTHLLGAGVSEGDRVVALCDNHIGMMVCMYACWWIGAIFLPMNPEHSAEILGRMTKLAEPSLLVVDEARVGKASQIGGVRTLKVASLLSPQSRIHDGSPAWDDPKATAAIYFSSGTTGVSKACVMSHEYLVWSGEEFSRASGLSQDDLSITLGPFHHVNALWSFTGSVLSGVTHAFERRFSASRFWPRTAAVGATIFDYVGAIIPILLRTDDGPKANSVLRRGIGGAARAAEIPLFEERFRVTLLECYGLTECLLPIYQKEAERRAGSIGVLSEYFQSRVVGTDGRDVAVGSLGELWLKPLVKRAIFDGYWRNPEATHLAFEDDWFKTGDFVRQDEDGYFYFVDRGSQVIRRRGENISAYDLEGIILRHPAIKMCAAVGVPSELGEEDVLVAVELEVGAELDPSELAAWCDQRMARFMVPRYVRVMKIPMTASEKVAKQRVRAEGVTTDTFDRERSGEGFLRGTRRGR